MIEAMEFVAPVVMVVVPIIVWRQSPARRSSRRCGVRGIGLLDTTFALGLAMIASRPRSGRPVRPGLARPSTTTRSRGDRIRPGTMARLLRINQAIAAAVPVLLPIAPHEPLPAEGLRILAAQLEEIVVDLRARADEVDQVVDAEPESA